MEFLKFCTMHDCEIRIRYYADNDEYVFTARYKNNKCTSIRICGFDIVEIGTSERLETFITNSFTKILTDGRQ